MSLFFLSLELFRPSSKLVVYRKYNKYYAHLTSGQASHYTARQWLCI